METPRDITAAVALMRELGIDELSIGDVRIKLGSTPMKPRAPGEQPERRGPTDPLSILASGTRLRLRRPPTGDSNGPGT